MCFFLFAILFSCDVSANEIVTAPNDSLFSQQRKLFETLHVLEAWGLTQGSPAVLIGVIDNGFDFYHPDLKNQLIPGFYASGGYHPENVVCNAHGTMVSSLINAISDNRNGISGLAPKCKILTASYGMIEHDVIKMQIEFKRNNPDSDAEALQREMAKRRDEIDAFNVRWNEYISKGNSEAIYYLVDRGVKVINMSSFISKGLLPVEADWDAFERAFSYAAEHDVIIVLGAGNSGTEVNDYPGNGENTIIAGASLFDDTRWGEAKAAVNQAVTQGSCYGDRLTVVAPVESLTVCWPHEGRFSRCDDGPAGPIGDTSVPEEDEARMYMTIPVGATSSAAPIVTSLVALVRTLRPDLDAKNVIQIIEQGADDIGKEGFDIYTGYGRVNFLKTLELAQRW